LGLGGENTSPAVTFKWSDQFWVDVYNKAASSFKGVEKKKVQSTNSSESEASSSESDFDGEIVIKKSKQSLTKLIKKAEKETKKDKKKDKKKKNKEEKSEKRKKSKVINTIMTRSRCNSILSEK